MSEPFFEKLKKKPSFQQKDKSAEEVYFQLLFDDYGAYLEMVDARGKLVSVDYRQYSGAVREVLRSLESIQEKNSFVIDWEKKPDLVYLPDHAYLMWQLRLCDNVIDAKGKPITFEPIEGKVCLSIEVGEHTLTSNVWLWHANQEIRPIRAVCESYVISDTCVYPILPLGNHFDRLAAFDTRFPAKDLEKFLSLLTSFFQSIEVRYQDYQVVSTNHPIHPQPTLVFEKIDENNSLYLRVTQVLSGMDVDFLEQYEVDKIVAVNDLERTLTIRPIAYQPYTELIEEVVKLAQGKSKAKKNPDFFQEENLLVIPEQMAQEFIRNQLPNLLGKYQLFGAEKLKSYRITTAQPRLVLALSSGIDFLEGEASLEIEGQTFSLFDVISQFHKNRYVKLSDGTQAILNEKYISRLERLFKKKKEKVRLSFFDLPLVEELIEEKMAGEVFARSREVFQGFNQLQKKKVRLPFVQADLRPYQEQGYKWLEYLHQQKLGGCLADDMGLGKTLQTITMLASLYPKEKRPSLIVMPKSLLFNWENELRKFSPGITFYTFYADNRDLEEACRHHLILTTYAIMRNEIEQFQEKEFHYVILDESQNAKNLHSQVSKAVMLLNGKHRLALSGTPVENNLMELYSLFRFLNPAMFGSAEDFNRYYAVPIQQNNDKEVSAELRRKVYPFILRRLKKDVLKELPSKIEQVIYVEMSEEQKRFYEQRRTYYYTFLKGQIGEQGIQKSQFFILQALTELRQIASVPESKSDNLIVSAKREALMESVVEATANGHKVLIFSNFLNSIELIGEDLNQAGIDFVEMTGSTRDRKELVDRFQKDPQCRVFLMTLKTGGTGLNLTAADVVFIFDPWWNVAAESQAIDRAHRIGQDKTVFSYRLITKGTIEEKILQLQEKKRELFENIIGSDSASIKSLSENDIEFMLGG